MKNRFNKSEDKSMGFILSKLNNYHRKQFYNRDSLILQEIKSSYITEAKKEMEK